MDRKQRFRNIKGMEHIFEDKRRLGEISWNFTRSRVKNGLCKSIPKSDRLWAPSGLKTAKVAQVGCEVMCGPRIQVPHIRPNYISCTNRIITLGTRSCNQCSCQICLICYSRRHWQSTMLSDNQHCLSFEEVSVRSVLDKQIRHWLRVNGMVKKAWIRGWTRQWK